MKHVRDRSSLDNFEQPKTEDGTYSTREKACHVYFDGVQ